MFLRTNENARTLCCWAYPFSSENNVIQSVDFSTFAKFLPPLSFEGRYVVLPINVPVFVEYVIYVYVLIPR